MHTLRAENEQLSIKVHQLEEQNSCPTSGPLLVRQMDSLIKHSNQILHGPNTPARFPAFSMAVVTEEIQSIAPDVYQLFIELGGTERNATDTETSVEQKKAVMSLCTTLNARCRTANGLQLLLSFMLIARATSKQVGKKAQ